MPARVASKISHNLLLDEGAAATVERHGIAARASIGREKENAMPRVNERIIAVVTRPRASSTQICPDSD